ncbi:MULTISPECIES: PspC domain-containing protein [Streptomyces]|uniref:PspC domain-containing protein n=1 Tax=Streptomyces dengpaensis TaxID=2049881 RepID=A0ABN5I0Q0_9ACTN|nr:MULTISPECIES: PspC domain-containing protein [Streptomyces]AVH56988.1 PspC domain-containing protein [Streptomyces dengpaensis]PIB09109.1 hypothetical protein B1C81_12780 [Streptomyces sp. HG99]
MTDQQHAAAEPDPGPGPGAPPPGTGPRDAVPPAPGPAEGEEPRAHEDPTGPTDRTDPTEPADSVPSAPADPSAAPGEPGAGGPEAPEVPRKFRRDHRQKMLGGVCAGLGRHCDMDPVIFRIVLAVLSATGGIGLIFYGFVWLFVPYDDEEENEVRKLLTGRVDGQALAAVLFALVGCGVFLSMLNNGGVLTFAVVLSLLLAGAGYWSQQRGAPDPLAAQAVADAPPEAQAPPVPDSYPSWWRDPIVKDGSHVGGTGYLWGPKDARDRDVAAAINIARGTTRPDLRGTREPRPQGPRWIGGKLFLLTLLAGGLGTGLTWDDHTLGTSLQTGLACALIVLGLGIAVSAFLGRTGAGSIILAVLISALLGASAALPKDITTHWIRTEWTPTATADVQQTYDLGTGVGTLDLTRLDLAKGQTVTTTAEVGVGQLKVLVPEDVTVKLNVDVGVGDIQLPGDDKKDVDVEPGKSKQVTLIPTTADQNGGTLNLDLHVGVGQAEVTRATS